MEVFEAERAELWDEIVSHNNNFITAQPPAEYQEKINLFKEINQKIIEKLRAFGEGNEGSAKAAFEFIVTRHETALLETTNQNWNDMVNQNNDEAKDDVNQTTINIPPTPTISQQ